jgi:hypothetical protein
MRSHQTSFFLAGVTRTPLFTERTLKIVTHSIGITVKTVTHSIDITVKTVTYSIDITVKIVTQ